MIPPNRDSAPSNVSSPVADFRRNLASGAVSAVETVASFLEQAKRKKHLNVYITEAGESALAKARESDDRIAKGEARALEGMPIAVKDNFCTLGLRTTAASKMLENFIPAYESTVTQKLLDAGAIILGKTNMDEFAMGSSTESSFFGPTINPAGEDAGIDNLVPGGSSGGSAAAIAADLALAALGTDTGGSIRQPASFCGVAGFKPTYGTCSRWGIISYGSSLDQAGVFGKSVADIAILMDVMAGEDPKDTTSSPNRVYDFEQALTREPRKLRIGFAREVLEAGSTPDTELVWDAARKIAGQMGAEIVDVSIPSFSYALPAYYVIALSEASSNLARYDGVRYGYRAQNITDITDLYERSRGEGFGAEVKRRIMLGTFSLSSGYYDAYYLKAQKVRQKIAQEFAAAFAQVDFLFMPTAPTAAFPIGAHKVDPVAMYLEDIFTVPVNLAGLPAISVPALKNAANLPLGLQIVGPQMSDEGLISAAARAEQAALSVC